MALDSEVAAWDNGDMSKCRESLEQQHERKAQDALEERAASEKSPLLRALRAHFEHYSGLVEPRLEIAAVSLRPSRDDL